MAQEKLLTIREAAHYLDIAEKDVITLSQEGEIPAYKIGGVYLRFKRNQLDKTKDVIQKRFGSQSKNFKVSGWTKLRDFLYFNDFYIASAIVLMAIVFFIIYE